MGKILASGAMGSVFPVQRLIDKHSMIAKMVVPKSQVNRDFFHDEVGLMMLNDCD
jgi:hypothetical protein